MFFWQGDAHGESWEILARKDVGLRDRMSRIRDTFLRYIFIGFNICIYICVCIYI